MPNRSTEEWAAILKEAHRLVQLPASADAERSAQIAGLMPALLRLLEDQQVEIDAVRGERDSARQQLKTSQAQLVQSGKMAAVGQLAAGVAHEVNNPLQIILSRVQLLMMRNREAAALVKDLLLIESNVKRISRIIRSLLDFARHNSGEEERQSINLVQLVTQTTNLMQHLMEKASIALQIDTPERSPRVFGNVGEIEQVFLNLLINAQQALPRGGQIDIEMETRDGAVVVRVRDTGIGIPQENLPHIFEPFFTTREEQGGTGLGLAIISGIIEKHNGCIEVASLPGKGTTFTLSFPAE